jgi:carbamoyl-phosphate synthase small subunit
MGSKCFQGQKDEAKAMTQAFLVLDDGTIFEGKPWAKRGETFGEAVFSTGMTGYQETLTDPSYHKQVVIMTAPHIGNTGVNREDMESRKIWVSGFVVRDPSPIFSNWRADKSLEAELIESDVVGICDLDTRAVTRHLRDRGAMRVGIFSELDISREEMVAKVRNSAAMKGAYLAGDVSTPEVKIIPADVPTRFKVAALDLGIKDATPRNMALRGIETTLFPVNVSYQAIKEAGFDGLFLSNGPGDPATMDSVVALVRQALDDSLPIFGICFGHQILGRALGFETYKLRFGHRGINQPVMNTLTGKVEITAHNHGFAVDAPREGNFATVFGAGVVSHINLNDRVVEGLKLHDRPAFSVQYHPEAAAGPHDANYLFDQFAQMLEVSKRGRGNAAR